MAQLTIQQAFDIALQHHQAGRLQEAEHLYRQILSQQPQHVDALHFLGVLAHQVGRNDLAVDLIRQALALRPNWPKAQSNLSVALQASGCMEEAIAVCRQALTLQPDYPQAHYNLGTALQAKGQLDEAIAAYRQALALQPNYPEAHNNLGNALKEKGQLDEAIVAYHQTIALQPSDAEAYNNLGTALKAKGYLNEAITAYRQAIALNPNYPEAYNNLGDALEKGRQDEAIAAFRQALALKPNFPQAHSNLGNVLKAMGHMEEAIAAYRQALTLKPDFPEVHSNLVFSLYYHPGFDASTIAQELRRWNQQHAESLKKFIQPHHNDRSPDRRLRIGYVSSDLREHVVARFLQPLLENHDHQGVEVFAYAQVPVPDAMTERLRAHTDAWRSLVGLSDGDAADLIRQDRIDILVDLALHTSDNRLLVFARKPAPVQVTYLAYAGSSGLSTMDYRLSDSYLDPPGGDESVYSEQTIRLPETYWCYRPVVDQPLQPPPLRKNGFVTFGCLNNFCKVNEPLLNLWAHLLGAVPHSRLLLHTQEGTHRQRVLDLLQCEGIEPERVSFVGKVATAAYFELYQSIDIALDTFPYGGGTTTCDALWMGAPVVSLAGKTAVGRGGLSILSNVGLTELVANTPEHYVQIAVDLANDLSRLTELRLTLRQRMQASPLMDAPRFARSIESAYRRMWQKWCERDK